MFKLIIDGNKDCAREFNRLESAFLFMRREVCDYKSRAFIEINDSDGMTLYTAYEGKMYDCEGELKQ